MLNLESRISKSDSENNENSGIHTYETHDIPNIQHILNKFSQIISMVIYNDPK